MDTQQELTLSKKKRLLISNSAVQGKKSRLKQKAVSHLRCDIACTEACPSSGQY